MFYNYQKKAIAQVHELFETVNKVCLAVSCSGGKTIMAIGIANDFIISDSKIKILILTHGQVLLRQQFNAECQQFEKHIGRLSSNFKNAAIEKSSELNKLYKDNNVLIAIPQTIKNLKNLPKFDLVIIDEAHQFYSASMVSRIIKSCKANKELVLTGTPSYFIRHKWPIVPVSMGSLYPEFIQDFIIELAYSSSYVMGDNDYDYNRGEISKKSERKVLTKKGTRETLDGLLDFIHKRAKMIWKRFPSIANALIKFPDWIVASKKLEKTMIACQSQVQAKYVQEYFEEKGIKTLLSISEVEGASESIKTFNEFKVNGEVKILIVVGRGILGFNFPDMINVFDLTCSTNIERIFQLMSRVTRKSGKKCQKLFLKVAPDLNIGLKGKDYFNYIMSAVLSLTDAYWFTNFDGKNMLKLRIPRLPSPNKKRSTKSSATKKSNSISLQNFIGLPALKFFRDLKNKYNEDHYSYAYTTLGIVRHELNISKDLETASNEMTIKVCEWIKKEKRLPSQHSINVDEKIFRGFLATRKKAKGGDSQLIWYESDQVIAESFKMPKLFNNIDLEKESNKMTHEVCLWIKKNNRYPVSTSKDEVEKRHHKFIIRMRGAKKGVGTCNYYESNQLIAEQKGLPELFKSLEELSNKVTHEVCIWVKKNNRLPNNKSKDIEEKKYAQFVSKKIASKKGKGKGCWYESDQIIADSYKLSGIFEGLDREKKSNEMTRKLCGWIKKNKRIPSTKLGDEDERSFSYFIDERKKARNGKKNLIWYPSDHKIAISEGFPKLFDSVNLEDQSNIITREVCKWIKKNKKYPKSTSENEQERFYAEFINRKKGATREIGTTCWYDSDQKIVISEGFPDLLKFESLEEQSNKMTYEVCIWIKKNKRFPVAHSKNNTEHRYYAFLYRKKRAKNGIGTNHWYDSDQKIAESNNLPKLFSDRTKGLL